MSNQENIKISFVIPAYNEENFIGRCLTSVLNEIEKEKISAEVIVVNNNSSDKTKEIASKFKNILVIDEKQQGLTFARQAGFLKSRGELIANIDADTILTDKWIKKVIEEFDKNKNLVVLSGPQIYYDLDKKTLISEKIFYFIAYLTYLINKHILNIGSMVQGGNFIVRRDALLKVGGFNTNILFWGEDTDIAKRLHNVGDVKFTFKLPIYASGRRLKREGTFKTAWRYTINYFYVLFFNEPFHNEIKLNTNNYFLNFNKIYQLNENKSKLIMTTSFALLIIIVYILFYSYMHNGIVYDKTMKLRSEIAEIRTNLIEIYSKIK
jgi:glycosyltransferase involved in cell wall biosynthesis